MENKSDIIWHDCLDSTNSEARRKMENLACGTVISAMNQTIGRGQRGNSWHSAQGMNLTFSMILKYGNSLLPETEANCQFVISEAVALGVRSFLRSEDIDASVKWPNDIYCGDRKICGILIEHCLNGNLIRNSICGIGLNVNQTVFPGNIPNPVSMKMLTCRDYDIKDSLEALAGHILEKLGMVRSGKALLRKEYLDSMYRKDVASGFTDMRDGSTFTGKIRGIGEHGMLLVETEDGSMKEFAFKEISYII